MKLVIKAEQEQTKKDLLSFLENEQIELKEKPNSQETQSLSELLASMAAWLEASEAPDSPSAEAFSKILYASKYYE